MAKRQRQIEQKMTCDICGRSDPTGRSIDTLVRDVSADFDRPEGRIFYCVNFCEVVRSCEQGAAAEVQRFVEGAQLS